MKRFLTISVPLAALLAIISMSSSCEKYILPKIELEKDSLFFFAKADSAFVSITANVDWKVVYKSGDFSFCTISPESGSENGKIKVKVQAATKELSECVIGIQSEIICKEIYIRQTNQQTSEK